MSPPRQMPAQDDDAIAVDSRSSGVSGVRDPLDACDRGNSSLALERLGVLSAGHLLLATDFDGTLAPIVQDPDRAEALPANLHLIANLIHHGVHAALISGRAQIDLRQRVPLSELRILGENGMGRVTNLERQALDRFNRKVARFVAQMVGVRMERKPGSTSLHYRRASDAGNELWTAVLPIAKAQGLKATPGRMVIEVAPTRADKSRAMAVLIAGFQPKVVVYAGDDEPDNSVFRLLRHSPRRHLAIGVASRERSVDRFEDCDVVVDGPEGMSAFLRNLLERVSPSKSVT